MSNAERAVTLDVLPGARRDAAEHELLRVAAWSVTGRAFRSNTLPQVLYHAEPSPKANHLRDDTVLG